MRAVLCGRSAVTARKHNAPLLKTVQCSTRRLLLLHKTSAAHKGDSPVFEMNDLLKSGSNYAYDSPALLQKHVLFYYYTTIKNIVFHIKTICHIDANSFVFIIEFMISGGCMYI